MISSKTVARYICLGEKCKEEFFVRQNFCEKCGSRVGVNPKYPQNIMCKCGKSNLSGSNYCIDCGKKLKK